MKILSLDLSVNDVGWSVFENELNKESEYAWTWGTWHLEGSNYLMRLVDLRDRISEDIGDNFTELILEWPTFFNSNKGQVAAHQNYTIDLAGQAMYIAGWFGMDHRDTHLFTPTQWKGSVPKAITERKFLRKFGIKDKTRISSHAIDATMMLYYFMEKAGLLPEQFQVSI